MHFSKPAEFNSFEICLEFYFIFIHLFFFFFRHSRLELMTYMSFDECFRFHCRRVGLRPYKTLTHALENKSSL